MTPTSAHEQRFRVATGRHRPSARFCIGTIGLAMALAAACSEAATTSTDVELVPSNVETAGEADWASCEHGECALVTVPVDHDSPDGPSLQLAVSRSRAASPEDRIGVLLVNPGGPGAAGRALAAAVAAAEPTLRDRFDIVGWDPRGTGASRPLDCAEPILSLYERDLTATTAAERAELADVAASIGPACLADDAELLPHMATRQTVADMDEIRSALGEDTISYLGFSYGSVLGLEYASAHPDRLRVAVLDGIVDPAQDLESWLTGQAVAAETLLDELLAPCDRCEPGPREALHELREEAARRVADDLDATDIARAVVAAGYRHDTPSPLVAAVESAIAGDGSAIRELADQYLASSDFDAYTATLCLDKGRPIDAAGYQEFIDRADQAAPLLGAVIAGELSPCASWPFPVASPPPGTTPVPQSVPLLLVGSLGDAVTPYRDAAAVGMRLPGAALLTHDGRSHTSFFSGDACVTDAVARTLVDGSVGDSPTRCPPE